MSYTDIGTINKLGDFIKAKATIKKMSRVQQIQ